MPDANLTLSRYSQWASHIRVPAGFLLAAIYVVGAEPRKSTLLIGCSVAAIGLFIRAHAAGIIEKNERLAVNGPYAHTRNPLYLGSAVAAAGFAIAAGKWWLFLLLGTFFALVYIPVIQREQARMFELFGSEYEVYSTAVPLLLPRLTPWRPQHIAERKFSWQRYWKNHEYRAAGAFVLVAVLLLAKMKWLS